MSSVYPVSHIAQVLYSHLEDDVSAKTTLCGSCQFCCSKYFLRQSIDIMVQGERERSAKSKYREGIQSKQQTYAVEATYNTEWFESNTATNRGRSSGQVLRADQKYKEILIGPHLYKVFLAAIHDILWGQAIDHVAGVKDNQEKNHTEEEKSLGASFLGSDFVQLKYKKMSTLIVSMLILPLSF